MLCPTHKRVLKGAGKLNPDHRERTEFAAATPSTPCMPLGCLLVPAPPSCCADRAPAILMRHRTPKGLQSMYPTAPSKMQTQRGTGQSTWRLRRFKRTPRLHLQLVTQNIQRPTAHPRISCGIVHSVVYPSANDRHNARIYLDGSATFLWLAGGSDSTSSLSIKRWCGRQYPACSTTFVV